MARRTRTLGVERLESRLAPAVVVDPVDPRKATYTDVDGDALHYAWSFRSMPAGSAAALMGPQTVAPHFAVDLPGTYVVQLVVGDGQTESVADTVSISTQNSRPVADAGADVSVRVGELAVLDGSGSRDADGDPLTYRWTLLTKPGGSAA